MKKTIFFAVLVCTSFPALAQDMYSAIDIGTNQYYGSARTIALGNAVTALGGDLGSTGINPAGSAVNTYSIFQISPSLNTSVNVAAYAPTYDPSKGLGNSDFGPSSRSRASQFLMPDIGLGLYMETGRPYGVKGISFSFVANGTNSYLNAFGASGVNPETSACASFASYANGVPYAAYADANAYNNYDLDYFSVMAAQSQMIYNYRDISDAYMGATEIEDGDVLKIGGPLFQRSMVQSTGYKTDFVINFGMNVDDMWYLGFNLGLPTAHYSYTEKFSESAENLRQFNYFDYASYGYSLSRDISGIYAKFGLIVLPTNNIRLGAAIQTPVSLTVKDNYYLTGQAVFTDGDAYSSGSRDNSYCLRAPWRFNLGAAFTFSDKGLLSVDYEMADFSVMRFCALQSSFTSDTMFSDYNDVNRLFCGAQHNIRIGGEINVTSEFALRAGYSILTSPEKYYFDDLGNMVTAGTFDIDNYYRGALNLYSPRHFKDNLSAISFGCGYNSPGSFFADFAVRGSRYAASQFLPYSDYIYADDGSVSTPTPTISLSRRLWDFVLTFGWRF